MTAGSEETRYIWRQLGKTTAMAEARHTPMAKKPCNRRQCQAQSLKNSSEVVDAILRAGYLRACVRSDAGFVRVPVVRLALASRRQWLPVAPSLTAP
eukprot:1612293-Rhodomonas_salina.2